MDRRVPALFALGIAFLLVANPVYLFPHAGQSEYTHDITEVPAREVPAEADVLRYANLSAEARAAIQDARTDDGIVYGDANKPPEFFYSDYAHLNKGIYYIQQDSTYYRLTTFAGGGLFPITLFLQWALVLLGLSIGLIGYISLRNRYRWLPLGFGIFGGVVLAGALLQPGRGMVLGVDSGPILLLTLSGSVAALIAIGATAHRSLLQWTVGGLILLCAVGSGWLFVAPLSAEGFLSVVVDPFGLAGFALIAVFITMGYASRVLYHRVNA